MKLKLVVASMSILGLISSPAFAEHQTKHTHHKKIHKTVVVKQDNKEIVALPVEPVAVVVSTEPNVDTYQTILDDMYHNTGRAKPMADWFNRIGVSGGANFDVKWGNRRPIYRTENVNSLALNDAYVNFNATANEWTKAFASVNFANPSVNYSSVYRVNSVTLEQGFVTVGNFDVCPLFLQVGKQFQDFGRYVIHPLNRTLAQSLSESLATSIDLGYINNMGFHGSVYAFGDKLTIAGDTHPRNVYGASIGFAQPNDQLGFDVGLGYMSNMTGVNDVAVILSNPIHLVGALSAYGDVNSGPFTLGARYTTAIQHFSAVDINTNASCSPQGVALLTCERTSLDPAVPLLGKGTGSGAQPWAADLTAGYGFNAMSKNQNIYLGYQASGDAVNLALPRGRILAGYNVDVWKYTNIGLEYTHDYSYSVSRGGAGGTTNTVGLRGAVKLG